MAEVSSALKTLNTVAEAATATNSAMEAVKKGLHSVKVCKYDATKIERDLEGELFDKWHEGCEVMKATKIPFDNISKFLDHMQSAYEGVDADLRLKMDGILYSEGTWEYKVIEWKFNKGDNSGARYGMIAFGRSPDLKYVDCMYVLYKMDFKIAPQEIVTENKHSLFFGLINWTTNRVQRKARSLGSKSVKVLQNFFRLKALEGFYKEGVIENVNYVTSLEDVPDNLDPK